jgi:site-specific DNA recombinase
VDDGLSGASLERPGLDQMRDRALASQLTHVYVLSPDRLSRKSAHQILLIEEMKRLGVTFVFVNRQIGDTPEDQLLLQVQGVVSEYEREKIIERCRRGKLYAAKKGRVNVLGGAPYGYHYQKATEHADAVYKVHPQESLVVQEAFALYARNESIGEIARRFTEKEYCTRTGKTFWERSVIWGMLKNPAYMGKAGFRKTKRVRRLRKTKLALESKNPLRSELSSPRDRPEEDRIYINVPAIVDARTFEIVQQRLEANKKFSPRNNKRYNYLLSGLLRCSSCGYSIYGKPASSSKYKRLYYRCMGQDGHRWQDGRVCKGHPVRVEAIDDLVWSSVKKVLVNPETMIEEYTRRLGNGEDQVESLLKKKQIELKKYQAQRSRLIDLFQNGLVGKEEIETQLRSVQAKMEHSKQEAEFLKSQIEESKGLLTLIQSLSEFKSRLGTNLEQASFEERRKIIRLLVEEIKVDTIRESITVKHIVPIDAKKCQLRSGTQDTALRRP